jgi:hypothetical protein
MCRLLNASILNFKFLTALKLEHIVTSRIELNLEVSLNYLLEGLVFKYEFENAQ